MVPIGGDLVQRWGSALAELSTLDRRADARAPSYDEQAVARECAPLRARGPLAAFDRYLELTDRLEEALAAQDAADPAIARARSAGAAGDLAAACLTLDLAARERGGHDTAHVLVPAAPIARRGADAHDLRHGALDLTGELTGFLADAHRIRGAVPSALPAVATVREAVDPVLCDAVAVLQALDASGLAEHGRDGIGCSLSTLLDDEVLGKLVDASAHAVGFLHRRSLDLAHRAMRKLAGLCDDDVRKALACWFDRDAAEAPLEVVGRAAGADVVDFAWTSWSQAGLDTTAHLPAATVSRDEHLLHLAWARRSVDLAATVHRVAHAEPPTAPFAAFFGGVALVGIAGWALWAAGDHCREVADLP